MFIRSFVAVRLAFTAFAVFALSAAAEAAVYISYVASNGNDANPCTVVTAPCKTLTRAIAVTSPNGTVRVLTALQGNVTINKSITITGDGTPIVGAIAIGGADTKVTLRGLQLNGVGIIATGIRIDIAAIVRIEDCTVERYTSNGINLFASAAMALFVSDSVVRDNGGTGLNVMDASAQVVVENSRFERNTNVGLYLQAARASVIRSVASGNAHGILVADGTAQIIETTAANNTGKGVWANTGGAAILASSVASGNQIGLYLDIPSTAIITDSAFTHNNTGIYNYGTIYSRQTNTVSWNVTDYTGGEDSTIIPEPAF